MKKKKAPRSPKYPIFGLETAIERLIKLYERERTAPVLRDIAVKAWGYKGKSGSSLQTIATLIQYGLIERIGGQKVKITELGLDILLPKSSGDKTQAIQTAANSPMIFRELLNQYPESLPSDDTITAHLVRRNVPYTEESAKKLIKSLKKTIAFAGMPEKGIETAPMRRKEPPSPQAGDYVLLIPLPGRKATLTIADGAPTNKDIGFIRKFLDFYEETLQKDESDTALDEETGEEQE